jgi:hypothetical protein
MPGMVGYGADSEGVGRYPRGPMFRNSEGVGPPPRAVMFRNSEGVGRTPPHAVMFRNSEGVDTAVDLVSVY